MGDVLDSRVKVPLELLSQVDLLVDYLDFESREAFVETAIRRFIDFYSSLMPSLTTNKIIT
jgi:metal-responsive CopG/Arc/MetJ family transcriptional regulator